MMKKVLRMAALIGALTIGCGVSVNADGLEEFNDYALEDGTYNYYFMQGLMVNMSKQWYQNTFVKADETSATFYHRASYEKYEEEGMENGGQLFTISYSVNTDFKDLNEMTYIGFDEETCFNYFAVKPTDYTAYASDSAVRSEYDALWSEVDDVIGSIRLVNAAGGETVEETASSDLFETVGNDLFSFQIAKGWTVKTEEESVIAVKNEKEEVPFIKIEPVTLAGSAGEEVVKWKNEYVETYQNRVAAEPEVITYEVEGTDRALAGVRVNVSSEDGMDTVTHIRLIEPLDGQYVTYDCAYISSTYAEDRYEDETTYFELIHAIETMRMAG